MTSHAVDQNALQAIGNWYRGLNFLERVGLWTLVAVGATTAVVALMHPHLQVAVGGALLAAGAKMLVPIFLAASHAAAA